MELGTGSSTQSLGIRSAVSGGIYFSKERNRLRTGLIILCVVLFLICLGLSAYLIWKALEGEKDEKTFEVKHCTSHTCLEVAAALKQSMNESVDPCEDFFQYSCGGWISDNPIPPSETMTSTFYKLAKHNDEKLLLLLLEDDDLPSEHAVKKAKNYFKSCMAEDDNNNNAKVFELKSLINRFGSWPLETVTWNEATWSFTEALLKIHRDFSAVTPLFKMAIKTNPFDSSRYILQV